MISGASVRRPRLASESLKRREVSDMGDGDRFGPWSASMLVDPCRMMPATARSAQCVFVSVSSNSLKTGCGPPNHSYVVFKNALG